jgi:hypothetical protein
MKSESFSLNQLDKLISSIALQQGQRNISISTNQQDLLQKGNEAKIAVIKPKVKINHLVFGLLQLFFAAIAILIIRYFYFQAEKYDFSAYAGIVIIMIALDVLIIKRFKPKDKSASTQIIKKLKVIRSKKRYARAQKMAVEEIAAVQVSKSYIEPKDLETKILLEETPKLACLVGFSDNVQDKIIIDKPNFVIGRIRSRADYISSNSAVGKLHAEITNRDGVYYIKDLNSRNGTYINGERIVSNVEHSMRNNDRIAFANSEYKFLWS